MKRMVITILALMTGLSAQAQLNPDVDTDSTKWFNRTQQLKEVSVKAKRRRYSRKDNPAVELMRRVIAAKKQTDLSRHDYYQYNKYEKLTLAMNDLQPHTERTIIRGQQSSGVNDLFQTGDILNIAVKNVFADVNLYDDQIRLLQYLFTSPIGKDAVAFYRFVHTDKNNPFLTQSPRLMPFPEGCYVMDSDRPYTEVVVGIHNIFKLLHVEYVRRLSYLDLPTSEKQGVRFTMRMTF